jgi:hypothetical protein
MLGNEKIVCLNECVLQDDNDRNNIINNRNINEFEGCDEKIGKLLDENCSAICKKDKLCEGCTKCKNCNDCICNNNSIKLSIEFTSITMNLKNIDNKNFIEMYCNMLKKHLNKRNCNNVDLQILIVSTKNFASNILQDYFKNIINCLKRKKIQVEEMEIEELNEKLKKMNKSRKIAIFLKAVPDNKNCFCY